MDLPRVINCFVIFIVVQIAAVVYGQQSYPAHIQARFTQDCYVDGKHILSGNNFTTKTSGPCITYKCQNRAAIPIDLRCPYNKQCVPVGYNITTSQCIVEQCQRTARSASFQIIQGGCSTFSRGCIGVNGSYKDQCLTYTCHQNSNVYRLEMTDWGCHYNNSCLKQGETVSNQCSTQQCEKRDNQIGLYTVDRGCPFLNDRCLKAGELGLDKCRLYTCNRQLVNGEVCYTVKQKAAMCEDSKGVCHRHGSKLQLSSEKNTCTCVVDGFNVKYKCH